MADVSAAMKDWSPTDSSNNPSGSTNIGTGLDDNIRAIQGSVVRNLHNKGADIASATTTDLGAVEGLFHDITGTTTITGFGTVRAGVWKVLKFEGVLTLTHNATSLILPGAANITTADGDIAIFVSEGSGNWRCVNYMPASGNINLKTEVASTSGTSIDFTGIPNGVKRITIMFVGVSTNGTSNMVVQIGDAGGIENTGYVSKAVGIGTSTISAVTGSTAALILTPVQGAGTTFSGQMILSLEDSSDNTWVSLHTIRDSASDFIAWGAGDKALSAVLDRVRITTAGGSDTFDTGAINISFER